MNTHTVILDKLRHSVAHPTLRTFLFYAIIALILIKAMGYSGGKGIDILFIALILLLLSNHSLTRYGLIIPFILLCALYAPVGAIYGSPSAAVVSALLQTNSTEASEFLHTLPARCYLLPVVIFTMLIILKGLFGDKHYQKNHIAFAGVICGYRHHQNIQRWLG